MVKVPEVTKNQLPELEGLKTKVQSSCLEFCKNGSL